MKLIQNRWRAYFAKELRGAFIGVLFLCFLFGSKGYSKSLKVTWLGTTCVHISDGKTAILFDPFLTRPSLLKLATFQKLKSDPEIVNHWLQELGDIPIKGIFVSHSHYDHILDLVTVLKATDAKVYGSQSTQNVAIGGNIPSEKTQLIAKDSVLSIGDFKVQMLPSRHPPHFLGWTLFDGVIARPLIQPARVNQYKKGEGFNFFIKHEWGNILYHPSSLPNDLTQALKEPVNLVLVGIANRKNDSDIINKILKPFDTSMIIPIHHDNFFSTLSKETSDLPFVNKDKLKAKIKSILPKMQWFEPKIGEATLVPLVSNLSGANTRKNSSGNEKPFKK